MPDACRDEDSLLALLTGMETPTSKEDRAHVDTCARCQESMQALESMFGLAAYLAEPVAASTASPMPADMAQSIHEKATAAWRESHPAVHSEGKVSESNYYGAAAVIIGSVALQWMSSWIFLWLSTSALARVDWWASMFQNLTFTGLFLIGVFLVREWLSRVTLKSWRTVILTAAVAISLSSSLGFARIQQDHIRASLDDMFLDIRWCAYDPRQFNIYPGKERMPTLDEIEKDLELLHNAKTGSGFDGLITFKANDNFGSIPRIAKQKVGFKKVIMGVYVLEKDGKWGPPEDQMKAAIDAREWVDGYCLGHNTPTQVDIEQLRQWMADLRHKTGKPVTTTAPLVSYLGERGRALREIGDWYFPDVRGSWVYGAPPEKLIEELHQAVRDVTNLPSDRPVLLKMISCPAGPEPRFTPKAQADFYTWIARDLYLPPGVFLSYYNGFDLPWMNHEEHPAEWSPGQQYVGFFTAKGEPRPSVEVVRKGFPVQRRP